jgi:hypothetical protein
MEDCPGPHDLNILKRFLGRATFPANPPSTPLVHRIEKDDDD